MLSDPAKLPPFVYTPLAAGEIRLLVPDALQTNDALSWTLVTANLGTELGFDALSYTWGSQAETFPVVCNKSQLRVHHNLYCALPYLSRRRKDAPTQPIWIDAVCINQSDEEEKHVQINLMNQIYRRATKVWAWLGLAKEQSYVPRILSLIPLIVEYNKQIEDLGEDSIPERPAELRQLDPPFWDTAFHLFRNPWCQRVWILQEVALAQDIAFLCGDHEISFAALNDVLHTDEFGKWKIQDSEGRRVFVDDSLVGYQTVFAIRKVFKDRVRRPDGTLMFSSWQWKPLRVVLLMMDGLNCFAPQDRVFGLLGLLTEMDPDGFGIPTDTSVPDLYNQFSRYILSRSDRDLCWWEYFNSAFTFRRTEGLPSWVPDLHFQKDSDVCASKFITDFCGRRSGSSQFQASTKVVAFATGVQADEIVLRGCQIDRITLVHPAIPELPNQHILNYNDVVAMAYINLYEWERKLTDTVLARTANDGDETGTGTTNHCQVKVDTYWRTLIGDHRFHYDITHELTEASWQECRSFFRQAADVIKKSREKRRLIEAGEIDANISVEAFYTEEEIYCLSQEFWDKFKEPGPIRSFFVNLQLTQGRQLFHTVHGLFGFTLKGVQPGDLVCVLNGSPTPHVIRRADDRDGSERYKLVGDAYVHDLMHGEADKMDLEERDFVFV